MVALLKYDFLLVSYLKSQNNNRLDEGERISNDNWEILYKKSINKPKQHPSTEKCEHAY
jgi:hypothetical protein